MSTLENDDDDDEIDPFTTFLSSNGSVPSANNHLPAADPHFRRHRVVSINADILIRQLPSEGLSFQLWPSATTLFCLLDRHRLNPTASPLLSTIPHRQIRILELGSGTGLVGIAAAAILGADVTVTDLAHVIPNLKFNAEANLEQITSGGGTVEAAELSWGNKEQMEAVGRDYDVIMGSDLVYHDHLYELLMETLKYLLLPGGERKEEEKMVFLMAHLKRWKKEAAFFRRARKVFDVKVIHRDCPSDGKRVGVTVYRFVGKHCHGSGLGSGCNVADPKPSKDFHMENGF